MLDSSVVALVPRSAVRLTKAGVRVTASSLGEAAGLCEDEEFAEQPALAVCSGILIDWDLVLTGGHCVRRMALAELAVLFGFKYIAPGVLGELSADDVHYPEGIVSERLDASDATERVDYAVIRLSRSPGSPKAPVALRGTGMPLDKGEPLIVGGFPGGVPLKLDTGGRVRDSRRRTLDYFLADTDTVGGSSGSAALTEELVVAGVLARGGPDSVSTPVGCEREFRQAEGAVAAEEQFTYSHRVLDGLCVDAPGETTLCRADCGDPCEALPQARVVFVGACTMGKDGNPSGAAGWAFASSLLVVAWTRRWRAARSWRRHKCALMAGGGIRCWGDNVGGRLGDESARHDCAPTAVGTCQSAYRVPDAAFRSYTITSDDGAFAFATVPPRVVLDVSRPHESDAVLRRELDAADAGLTHLKLTLPPPRQAVRVIVLNERDQPVAAAQVLGTLPRAAISVQPGSVDGPGFALSHLQDGRRRA